MTEERMCCNCAIGLVCDECYEDNSKWQPIAQEKPMENKVIFESEEQARKMFDDCIEVRNDPHCDVVNESVFNAKQKGYIRKSAMEEAEEEYIAYKEGENCFVAEIIIDKMYLAIQELKSEIARLKK